MMKKLHIKVFYTNKNENAWTFVFLKVEPEGLADHWKRRVSKDINPLLLIFRNMDWNWEYLKVYILCFIQNYYKLKQNRIF